MRYIKTFEDLKNTVISIKKLMDDCLTYDIDFFDLLKEMILNNIITFQCFKNYDNEGNYTYDNISKTGRIEDVDLVSEYRNVYEYDILVKMNKRWYQLTDKKINLSQTFTLYNHKKGKLEEELELSKSAEKFRI